MKSDIRLILKTISKDITKDVYLEDAEKIFDKDSVKYTKFDLIACQTIFENDGLENERILLDVQSNSELRAYLDNNNNNRLATDKNVQFNLDQELLNDNLITDNGDRINKELHFTKITEEEPVTQKNDMVIVENYINDNGILTKDMEKFN